jgi:hypothetical protein
LENVEIFYGNFEYFTDTWDNFWAFGTFFVNLEYFSGFGILHQEKSGNPDYIIFCFPGCPCIQEH